LILVDSSVWIDYFNGKVTPATEKLDTLLGQETLAIGDLILTEVLQGFDNQRDFDTALQLMLSLEIVTIAGPDLAVAAAGNYRKLRGLGVTVRKTIDTLIATRCIESGFELLHSDRDFEAFIRHLGLLAVAIR